MIYKVTIYIIIFFYFKKNIFYVLWLYIYMLFQCDELIVQPFEYFVLFCVKTMSKRLYIYVLFQLMNWLYNFFIILYYSASRLCLKGVLCKGLSL